MKLVMYSGGQQAGNGDLHRELIDLTGKRRGVSLTYIPFCADNSQTFYNRAIKRYQRFGASKFHCLEIDLPQAPSREELKRAFASDIVYLAGGNTFYFLYWLRKRGLLGKLKKFARDGGVLAGLSAGAHIMTPHIGLAGLKGMDPDENEVRLGNLNALGLVSFEFMPHFHASAKNLKILRKYSASSRSSIYACADGAGLVLKDGSFSIHGRAWIFHDDDWVKLT